MYNGRTSMRIVQPFVLLAIAVNGRAQSQPTFSTDVKIVSLLATVRDQDGRVVKNLTQDDFVVLEDGTPQKITFFSQESNLPLIVGLLVDTSRSQQGVLEQERRASSPSSIASCVQTKIGRSWLISTNESKHCKG